MKVDNHSNLSRFGSIYQALGVIGALVLVGLAISNFTRARETHDIISDANTAAAFTYLA